MNKKPPTSDSYFLVNGSLLKKARGDRKLSDVAREIGVARQRLCDMEHGRIRVAGRYLRELSRMYGMPMQYFIADWNGSP